MAPKVAFQFSCGETIMNFFNLMTVSFTYLGYFNSFGISIPYQSITSRFMPSWIDKDRTFASRDFTFHFRVRCKSAIQHGLSIGIIENHTTLLLHPGFMEMNFCYNIRRHSYHKKDKKIG